MANFALTSWLGRVSAAAVTGLLLPAAFAASTSNVTTTAPQADSRTALVPTSATAYQAQLKFPDELTVLFNGSRHSKMEACGCRARNLGGVDKEATMMKAFRKLNPASVTMDAGGFMREFLDDHLELQTYYLLEALKTMGNQAVNIGYVDFARGISFLKHAETRIGVPLVSANVLDSATSQPLFSPFKILEVKRKDGQTLRVGVIGVTAPNYNASQALPEKVTASIAVSATAPRELPVGETKPETSASTMSAALQFATNTTTRSMGRLYQVVDELSVLEPLAKKLRSECDVLILLSYSGAKRTQALVEAVPLFDVAIAGDYQANVKPALVGPNKTMLYAPGMEGKLLGVVELAMSPDKKITDKFAQQLYVDQNIAPAPEMGSIFGRYKQDLLQMPAPAESMPVTKTFVGASSCGQCHAREYAQWKSTPHYKAVATLAKKQMQYNPDCLPCHTTGYGQPGGFTDLRVTVSLAGVQCESCHGSLNKHVEEQRRLATLPEAQKAAFKAEAKPVMTFSAASCVECHDKQNDPDFDFAKEIHLVDHTTSAPAAGMSQPASPVTSHGASGK